MENYSDAPYASIQDEADQGLLDYTVTVLCQHALDECISAAKAWLRTLFVHGHIPATIASKARFDLADTQRYNQLAAIYWNDPDGLDRENKSNVAKILAVIDETYATAKAPPPGFKDPSILELGVQCCWCGATPHTLNPLPRGWRWEDDHPLDRWVWCRSCLQKIKEL
jgi:hypothetical protein